LASLFLSYARKDAEAAEALARALEQKGHKVWWDRQLSSGAEFSREIERQIEACDNVLVLWSVDALQSPWVRDEAAAGRDLGKLVPMTIDGSTPPLGFRQFHSVDVRAWLADPTRDLPAGLAQSLGSATASEDPTHVPATQHIAFCRTDDGITLAYSKMGDGPPLVKVANWLNHLEHEWNNPIWKPWLEELASRHMLLRYDERGNGMSDWKIPEPTFDQLVDDLVAVTGAATVDQFDLIAISQGSPVAIAFAVRHPERVRRMVLINGFAAGWRHARDASFVESWEALSTLAKTGWDKPASTFRQVFTSQFFPDATPEQSRWWNDLQMKSASAANASQFMHLFGTIDVGELLPQVKVPTLVMHCRDDQLVPFEAGRSMAARIPGAEFVALDSRNHLPLASEPAWATVKQELRRFLSVDEAT
jgi:pimeloyl-ACP methyl ester carboxylesterase